MGPSQLTCGAHNMWASSPDTSSKARFWNKNLKQKALNHWILASKSFSHKGRDISMFFFYTIKVVMGISIFFFFKWKRIFSFRLNVLKSNLRNVWWFYHCIKSHQYIMTKCVISINFSTLQIPNGSTMIDLSLISNGCFVPFNP